MKDNNSESKEKIDALKQEAEKKLALLEARKKDVVDNLKKSVDELVKKSKPFKEKVLKKYKKNILGIVAVPPQDFSPDKKEEEKLPEILILVKIDDKKEIIDKLKKKMEMENEISKIAKIDLKKYRVSVILLEELWDMCLKSKYEVLSMIGMGVTIYDTGMIGVLRLTEVHKMKVLQKFEKYVVSYVIGGSMVRGTAVEGSDIDAYIVIDDTDVTRLTSSELKNRLMSMIYEFAHEAAAITGVKSEFQIQVYVLTDMWNSIKNAHPVIFTFLRDGIPLYDRGMFAPWKLLLKKGKITPSPEAVDQYVKSGKQMVERTKAKLKEIAQEDFFWATCTPTQGALMTIGIPPGAPKEVSAQIKEHFVDKGLLEKKYLDIWDQILKLRKDIEYGKLKEIDAKIIQEMFPLVESYLERLDKLMESIEEKSVKEAINDLYEKSCEEASAALSMVGVSSTKKDLIPVFKKNLVEKKLAPSRYLDLLKTIAELNKLKKSTRQEVASVDFEHSQIIREIYEMIRAQKGSKLEKYKVNVEFSKGKKSAYLWLLGDKAFIVSEDSSKKPKIKQYTISSKGELKNEKTSSLAEMDKNVTSFPEKPTVMTKYTIESLKKILSDDIKIVVG